jgi:hypothetical protein
MLGSRRVGSPACSGPIGAALRVHIGIGIAVSLIASTFMVEMRHSEAAPKASETATAWIRPGEATGVGRQAKPGDRIMVQFPQQANHLQRLILFG